MSVRAGYNSTRRNRKIGTSAQGHGQNNELVIPSLLHGDRLWAATLKSFKKVTRSVSGRELIFIIEEEKFGRVHACSVADICNVLKHVPFDDWHQLTTFVFRQPTRKQKIISPAWGRLFYSADLGVPNRKSLTFGPTLMLESTQAVETINWGPRLSVDALQELNRLRDDGHEIIGDGRRYLIHTTTASVRSTQLYRTLLHEIGHWVDFLNKVVRAEGDYDELRRRYFARPRGEREVFAHRYAEETGSRLIKSGIFPFDYISDSDE